MASIMSSFTIDKGVHKAGLYFFFYHCYASHSKTPGPVHGKCKKLFKEEKKEGRKISDEN